MRAISIIVLSTGLVGGAVLAKTALPVFDPANNPAANTAASNPT